MKVVLNLEAGGWLGGRYYLQNLALALRSLPAAEQPELLALPPVSGERPDWGLPLIDALPADAAAVFPNWGLRGRIAVPELHWIPDLQHRALPGNFGRLERRRRDLGYRRLARRARLVVVSSEAVRTAAAVAYRGAVEKLRVLHFRTVVTPDLLQADPTETLRRHELPDDFILIANQFWAHKNHATAFAAVERLPLPLVCTGETFDHRRPRYFEQLVESLRSRGVEDRVRILGVVPRSDYVQLVRMARVVLQPSLFEGWSSIVEDARAFGRPMALSDIRVHREQSPDGACYFHARDPEALAEAARIASQASPTSERDALANQRVRVKEYARRFVALVREAASRP